ncbi:hypothetical protein HMN09_00854000 [Mycena chlorophos]|uniref:Uncharacterized protein n=1 Tax=Mycena chlorophos TaxID=658473 RepID=A0A8H6W3P7_MYCCL|nr:hypothetical protein HMN09_00854000 [Mycena chlorophos]
MTQEELYEKGRALQARVNQLQQSQQESRRDALADRTNTSTADEDVEEAETDDVREVSFMRALGKKFCVTHYIWVPYEDEIFHTELSTYNPIDRFEKEKPQPYNRMQGALRDLREVIPAQYHKSEEFEGWVRTMFLDGQKIERRAVRNRLRNNPSLFELIGRLPNPKKPGHFFYDTFKVPILHENYDDSVPFDANKFLLNKQLFVVHAAITKGVTGGREVATGVEQEPLEHNEKLWGLKKTTPGMIAGAAVWLRWIYSRDEKFTRIGATTGINWEDEYDAYLAWLHLGLQSKVDITLELFRRWDELFYPQAAHDDDELADGDGEDAVQEGRDEAMELLRQA